MGNHCCNYCGDRPSVCQCPPGGPKKMLDKFADAAPRKRRKKTGEKATVETPACAWMKARGWYHKKYKSIGSRSAPDRIFAKGGRVFFCEFKKKGKKPTPLQNDEHKKMRSFGLEVLVCDDVEEFKAFVIQFEGVKGI